MKDYKCAVSLKEKGIKGSIHIPPKQIDVDQLFFNNQHINSERKHNVSETEAKEYINNALAPITKRQGLSENYYSKQGISYVNPINKEIKTSYSSAEYDEVVNKNYGGFRGIWMLMFIVRWLIKKLMYLVV